MKILEQFYRGRGRRQKVRRLAALLLTCVPPLNLLAIYVRATPKNVWQWESFLFWWQGIGVVDLLPSLVLVGAGVGLWHNHPWTRRSALGALTLVTLVNAVAAIIYKHLGLGDIATMVICNAAVGYIIYREEFPILELPPLPKIDAKKLVEQGAEKIQQFRNEIQKNITEAPEEFDIPEQDLGFRAYVPLNFATLGLSGRVTRISLQGFWVEWQQDARGKIAVGRNIRIELFPGQKLPCRLQKDDGKRHHYEFVQLNGKQRNALKLELSRYIKIAA